MRRLRDLAADDHAGIAVFSGLVLSVVLGLGAFAIDAGHMFTERRRVQSTADLAAIAAASDMNMAVRAASATVRRNGMPETVLQKVDLGVYTADPALAPGDRFKPSAAASAMPRGCRCIRQRRCSSAGC